MKKFFAASILICIVVCALTGCGSDSSGDKMEFEQLAWPTYENAKQIPIPQSTMADVRNKNSVRFDFYLADTTFEDYKAYVDECKAKGFTVDPVEQEYRYYAFNEDNYELTIQYQESDIMYVCVVEGRCDVEIKLLHTDKISADMYDIRIKIDGFWEEDSEEGDEVIAFDAYLKEGQHTLTIENDDDEDVCGRINFVVSADGEYFEFEIECLSNKVAIKELMDVEHEFVKEGTFSSEETTSDIVNDDVGLITEYPQETECIAGAEQDSTIEATIVNADASNRKVESIFAIFPKTVASGNGYKHQTGVFGECDYDFDGCTQNASHRIHHFFGNQNFCEICWEIYGQDMFDRLSDGIDTSTVKCNSCERKFKKTSDNASSIARTSMCTNCYENFKWAQKVLEELPVD